MNPVSIVTGGATGIGRSIAAMLAATGRRVLICCNSSEEQARYFATQLSLSGGDARFVCFDVRNPEMTQSALTAAIESFGEPAELVNNAGIARYSLFTDETAQTIDDVISTDLTGMMNVTRIVLPYMIRNKRGSIVNISSMWGQTGASCEVVYSAAKAGVIGFTKALAKEVAPSGVRVNCVSPGCVDTAMMSGFTDDELETIKNDIPLGRTGKPNEIAETVEFLLSDRASYITGHVLSVNGGMVI